MNDNYLWDRTGEPDPEVQELEDVLGTLRYQPRPLELPAGIQPMTRRGYFPTLAIAAMIAMMVLAGGIWVRFHRSQASNPGGLANKTETDRTPNVSPNLGNEQKNLQQKFAPPSSRSSPGDEDKAVAPVDKSQRRMIAQRTQSWPRRPRANTNEATVSPDEMGAEMTAAERAEGEAAKEQMMQALRLVSAKLNYAQRKTVGLPATNNIHNQHKVG
jgi:hypothetical protein